MKTVLAVAILGCLAVAVYAENTDDHWEDEHKCTPLKKFKVWRQWSTAWGEGRHRLEFSTKVWSNFFRAYPKAREMFPNHVADNIYAPKWQAIGQRVLSAFGMAIDTADDLEALKVMIQVVKTRHAEKGIKPEFYEAFRDELLHTLPDFLGIHFDYAAWHDCLDALVAALKG